MESLTWAQIRTHYRTLFDAARREGLTQSAIAKAGGLAGQNAISKLLNNHHQGPTAETLVKAIHGLGKDVSTFFAEVEHLSSLGRSHADRPFSTSPAHVIIERLDSHTVDTIVHIKAHFARLDRRLQRLVARMDAQRATDGSPDRAPSRRRQRHRRGLHKTA